MKIYIAMHGMIWDGGYPFLASTDKQKILDWITSDETEWKQDSVLKNIWRDEDEVYYVEIIEMECI